MAMMPFMTAPPMLLNIPLKKSVSHCIICFMAGSRACLNRDLKNWFRDFLRSLSPSMMASTRPPKKPETRSV
jgi:hypothetical protein